MTSTRDRMLDAAAHVMRTRGLAGATTKEIAKAAGYSEAALYKHFADKTAMFLAVLNERMPSRLGPLLAGLQHRVGEELIEDTLREVAAAAVEFYADGFPMAASLFADPALLAAHRAALRERGAGPAHATTSLAAYLAAERDLGRIGPDADPDAAAALLLGACVQHAFLRHFSDDLPAEPDTTALVATLMRGLSVGGGTIPR